VIRRGPLAQLAERTTVNREATGSIPVWSAFLLFCTRPVFTSFSESSAAFLLFGCATISVSTNEKKTLARYRYDVL
jgi:hypothetical protein